jgi:hypothetical protein
VAEITVSSDSIFIFSTQNGNQITVPEISSDTAHIIMLGTHPASYQMGGGASFARGKADHSPPTSGEVMKGGTICPLLHIFMVWCLTKNMDFTFTFESHQILFSTHNGNQNHHITYLTQHTLFFCTVPYPRYNKHSMMFYTRCIYIFCTILSLK